jgi:hypothetical protein
MFYCIERIVLIRFVNKIFIVIDRHDLSFVNRISELHLQGASVLYLDKRLQTRRERSPPKAATDPEHTLRGH